MITSGAPKTSRALRKRLHRRSRGSPVLDISDVFDEGSTGEEHQPVLAWRPHPRIDSRMRSSAASVSAPPDGVQQSRLACRRKCRATTRSPCQDEHPEPPARSIS